MKHRRVISRRDFLKLTAAASLGLGLSACGAGEKLMQTLTPTETLKPIPSASPHPTSIPTPGCIDFMELAPLPEVRGERYMASIPDTLDLQQRAEAVIAAITNCTDPRNNLAPYDNMYLWRNPPFMSGTTMFNGKYFEAMALLRHLTGSAINREVDQSWRRIFLKDQAGYPWWGIDGGRILAWLGNNILLEAHACWNELAGQVIEHLHKKMVFVDDYCYYPDEQGRMPQGWEATHCGWSLQGLAQLYAATQDSRAFELAQKTARFLKDHAGVFDEDGRFLARHPSDNGPALHFHHNGNALEGIAAYALAANDLEFASFAKSGYEWARSCGNPLVGFFPEYIEDWPDSRPYVDCETCCTADMIQIAMSLSQSGQGDYWDDVDRYVRNQFIEMQLMDVEWIDRMTAALPPVTPAPGEDCQNVAERIKGSFSSWAAGNDWYIEGEPGTTFCCIGNGGRAIFYVWQKMLEFNKDTLRVNLLFNRASPWADIDSYIPYEGRVDIKTKTGCNLEIRIPEWVKPGDTSCLVDGNSKPLSFHGRYAAPGFVEAGSIVALTFPISERTENTVIGNIPFSLVIKGNDVVAIDPPGKWLPFYQREKYRENSIRRVERERFVPETAMPS